LLCDLPTTTPAAVFARNAASASEAPPPPPEPKHWHGVSRAGHIKHLAARGAARDARLANARVSHLKLVAGMCRWRGEDSSKMLMPFTCA